MLRLTPRHNVDFFHNIAVQCRSLSNSGVSRTRERRRVAAKRTNQPVQPRTRQSICVSESMSSQIGFRLIQSLGQSCLPMLIGRRRRGCRPICAKPAQSRVVFEGRRAKHPPPTRGTHRATLIIEATRCAMLRPGLRSRPCVLGTFRRTQSLFSR